MSNKKHFGEEVSFLDILFNMALFFVVMFVTAVVMINEKQPKAKNAEAKAEYIMTIKWPQEMPVDIDTHLQDPLGNRIWFHQKDSGLMHLDRDDTGGESVRGFDSDRIEYKDNIEIVTLRGVIPGEYVLNIHAYSLDIFTFDADLGTITKNYVNIPVEVEITKLNPSVKLKFRKTVILAKNGDDITVTRFSIDTEGEIGNFNDLQKELVPKTEFNQ